MDPEKIVFEPAKKLNLTPKERQACLDRLQAFMTANPVEPKVETSIIGVLKMLLSWQAVPAYAIMGVLILSGQFLSRTPTNPSHLPLPIQNQMQDEDAGGGETESLYYDRAADDADALPPTTNTATDGNQNLRQMILEEIESRPRNSQDGFEEEDASMMMKMQPMMDSGATMTGEVLTGGTVNP